jgi:hypothetical protein
MSKLSDKWNNPFVFERISNIYTFSKDPLLKKNVHKHIFIPWNEAHLDEFMFKVKKRIAHNGKCNLPFMGQDLTKHQLDKEVIKQLQEQIQSGIETHLIMSNFDSIHVYRLDEIHVSKKLKSGIPEIDKNQYSVWFELGDMYVYTANHVKEDANIELELESLIMDQQTHNLFVPFNKFSLSPKKKDEASTPARWLEIERNLTYDYFIRSCELENNVYQDSWMLLSRRTQHCLISSELARHKGILCQEEEKLEHLKESFEFYFSALINELNEVYIRPIVKAFHQYDCLREAWDEIQAGLVHPKIVELISEFIKDDQAQLNSIEKFLEYQVSAKSFLFSLKNKFTKKIDKEEFLLLENFLCRQESLIESFSCRHLDRKLESLLEIKECIRDVMLTQGKLELKELKDYNLKLSHLLTIMSSTSYEDNIFFKLVEEKTSKGVLKRSFEDEVKQLIKLNSNDSDDEAA